MNFKPLQTNRNEYTRDGMRYNNRNDPDVRSNRNKFQPDHPAKGGGTDTFKRTGKLFGGQNDAPQSFAHQRGLREEDAWNQQHLRNPSNGWYNEAISERKYKNKIDQAYSQDRRGTSKNKNRKGKDNFNNDFSFDEGNDYDAVDSQSFLSPKEGAISRFSRQPGRGKSSRGFSFEDGPHRSASRSRSDSEHAQVIYNFFTNI